MIERQMKKYVRLISTNGYYNLSERYSIKEIFNKVIDANDHEMLELYDINNKQIYIRASMIEAIRVITELF